MWVKQMEKLMIKVDHISKQYVLGQIGGTTLRNELQRLSAKLHHREDPTRRIGASEINIGEAFLALDDVSFAVKPGERVGIIGRNGAGKSTLLKLISRVTAPSKGWIGLNGRVASMLEVGTGFHQELTGRENIYLNGAILGMTGNGIDEKIEDIIEFSECRQFIDTPVKRYSSGMYVKLAFSVAAHLDSEIMIMDEVLAVGDVAFQKKCVAKMADVSQNKGRTILYVSHNMGTIRELCNRCIVLDKGKLIYDGDVQQGIDVYMQTSFNEAATMNDVSNRRRRYVVGDHIRIQSIELMGKETPVYAYGDKMLLRFVLKVNRELKNICARMEISTLDGIRVGTTLTEDIGDVVSRTEVVTLSFGTCQIIPGQYCTTIVFYQKGANEETINHDCIENAFVFEIVDTERKMPLSWIPDKWGRVVLNRMEIAE